MMTQPGAGTRNDTDAEERYREASKKPRGDWGDVGFTIVDDEDQDEDQEGPQDVGR